MKKNIFKFLFKRKIVLLVFVIVLIGGGYFVYKAMRGKGETIYYVTAAVERGTLISSISSSGQVASSNQVDIKAKVAGEALYVGAKSGQEVKAGAVLARLDDSDAQRAVRDAQDNLETAKLSLEKLNKPADDLSVLQSESSLANARDSLEKLKLSQENEYQTNKDSKQKAADDLAKAYEDGFNNVANAFLELPAIMAGLQDMLFSGSLELGGLSQWNVDYYSGAVKNYDAKALLYKTDIYDKYQTARKLYDKNYGNYKSAGRFSSTSTIEALIGETYETTKNIAEAIKSANNLIQFYQDKFTEHGLRVAALSNTHLSSLSSYTGKTNNQLLSLLSIERSIQTNKETITNLERDLEEMIQNHPLDLAAAQTTLKEREMSLSKLKAGADAFDIRTQELAIKQKEGALSDARNKLKDYSISAPFDGVIAKIDIKKGDSISGGAAIATLVTKQHIAEISLNEIDAAKVKVGQKATLTFDAVSDLSITGEVAEIDITGTVTQGVVNYSVKISFDAQDDRVKPGMSVSGFIIVDVKQDVLLAPNAAVKQQGDTTYVEIMANGRQAPQRRTVTIGLTNDTMTEIVEGLNEGDLVVTQTNNTSAGGGQQNSGFRVPGLTGGGDSGPRGGMMIR